MPSRNTSHNQPRTSSLVPYLLFILFSAFFVFKVDVIISQKIFSPSYQIRTDSSIVVRNRNGTFHRHFIVSWGESNMAILDAGELLTLSLDKRSGSGFESRKEYLYTKIDMQIKLVPGNSAGTVTTYYLFSEGDHHDEIDFEFLGNSSGNPYTLHTNVFCQGRGDREQQFFLWFDPTEDFHTYTILWNPKNIIWYVDNIAIREFKNLEKLRVPYPTNQPMRIYSSLWNAEEWATQGGKVKTNWTLAPFTASYRNYTADGCIWSYKSKSSSCSSADLLAKQVMQTTLDERSRIRMKRLQKERRVYDYCKDRRRFPHGRGAECRVNNN